jgi:hypothetical protein
VKRELQLLATVGTLSVSLWGRPKTDVLVMRNGDRLTCEVKSLQLPVGAMRDASEFVGYLGSLLRENPARVDVDDELEQLGTNHNAPPPPGGVPIRPVRKPHRRRLLRCAGLRVVPDVLDKRPAFFVARAVE